MKKLITFISASALALGMSSALAAPAHLAAKADALQTTAKQAPSFLFVVSAGQAKIKKSKTKGEHVLAMNLPHINQIIMFSDRPNRIVKYINGDDLKKLWKQGSDSFASNPPNAVLSTSSMDANIVVLNGMKAKGNQVAYSFTSKQPIKLKAMRHITLTIDQNCGDGIPTGLSTQEWACAAVKNCPALRSSLVDPSKCS